MRKDKPDILLIVVTVCALLLGIGGYFVNSAKSEIDRFYFLNKGGAVLFSHQQHIEESSEKCVQCHHTMYADEVTECADCHDDGYDYTMLTHDEMIEIEDHECGYCHRVDDSKQAQSCRKCHPPVQDAESTLIGCDSCHEEDYSPDDLTHADLKSIEDHTCEGCHQARSVGEVYHEQCSSCHLIENHAKFAADDGKVRCEICHLK